jgi:uncharacterized protein (TIGR02147 family)
MQSELPNLFEYNNFRTFLADYQSARIKFDPKFTKSNICRRLGLPKTRSFFNDVINGRPLTSTYIDRFINLFAMNSAEAQFFRVLVKFNQAENVDEREVYFDQLASLNKTPKMIMGKKAYRYYKHWYNSVVRAVLGIDEFRGDDFNHLAKKIFPPVTPKQVKEAVELLIELKLVVPDEQGILRPSEKSIASGGYNRDEMIKQYQLQCLELAKKALVQQQKQPQNISTNILSISENGYKRIEKKLQRFKSEIRSIVQKDEDQADRIYQLDIILFPNSQ